MGLKPPGQKDRAHGRHLADRPKRKPRPELERMRELTPEPPLTGGDTLVVGDGATGSVTPPSLPVRAGKKSRPDPLRVTGEKRTPAPVGVSEVAHLDQIPGLRAMTVDDEIRMIKAQTPALSPDGTRSLFLQSELGADGKRSTRLMIASASGDPTPVVEVPDVSRPTWSPDGRFVAFLRSVPTPQGEAESLRGATSVQSLQKKGEAVGTAPRLQLFVVPATGGEPQQLTHLPRGVETVRPEGVSGTAMTVKPLVWSPDSTQLFFLSADPSKSDGRTSSSDAYFAFEGPHGQREGAWTGVYQVGLDGAPPARISPRELLAFDIDVSPDGRRLAYAFRTENARNAGDKTELAIQALDGGPPRTITDNQVPEFDVRFSPDGRWVSYLAVDDQRWELKQAKIWALDPASGERRLLSGKFDGAIDDYWWAPDGKSVLIHGAQRTTRGIFRLDVASGEVTPVLDRPGDASEVSISRDGTRALVVWSNATTPPDVYSVDLRPGQRNAVERLTHLNPELERIATATVERIEWPSRFDGKPVEGLLFVPRDLPEGTRAPTILQIHGGPAAVSLNTWMGEPHFWASMGYASLWPNPRGSKAYGDEWLRGNMFDIGGGDYHDVMSGIDRVIADGIADPDRLAVRGWSYGGILGSWVITQTDRFKAAMIGAPVVDWTSEYGQGFSHDVRLWYIGGTPWENPERYRQLSSYTHVGNVTTPTLLLHGDGDNICTPQQSMNFFNALWERGVPTRFVRFPREPHSLREPAHIRARLVEEMAWMEKHIRGEDWDDPPRP